MTTSSYTVEGMTCGGCAGKVTDEVAQISEVRDVGVDLATGGLTVTSDAALDAETIRAAVTRAGYKLADG